MDRFLQGESVAECGSIISHYFRTYFSLYVVPRGLTPREKSSLQEKFSPEEDRNSGDDHGGTFDGDHNDYDDDDDNDSNSDRSNVFSAA